MGRDGTIQKLEKFCSDEKFKNNLHFRISHPWNTFDIGLFSRKLFLYSAELFSFYMATNVES